MNRTPYSFGMSNIPICWQDFSITRSSLTARAELCNNQCTDIITARVVRYRRVEVQVCHLVQKLDIQTLWRVYKYGSCLVLIDCLLHKDVCGAWICMKIIPWSIYCYRNIIMGGKQHVWLNNSECCSLSLLQISDNFVNGCMGLIKDQT